MGSNIRFIIRLCVFYYDQNSGRLWALLIGESLKWNDLVNPIYLFIYLFNLLALVLCTYYMRPADFTVAMHALELCYCRMAARPAPASKVGFGAWKFSEPFSPSHRHPHLHLNLFSTQQSRLAVRLTTQLPSPSSSAPSRLASTVRNSNSDAVSSPYRRGYRDHAAQILPPPTTAASVPAIPAER